MYFTDLFRVYTVLLRFSISPREIAFVIFNAAHTATAIPMILSPVLRRILILAFSSEYFVLHANV